MKASLHMLDHNIELVHTNTKVSTQHFTSDHGDADIKKLPSGGWGGREGWSSCELFIKSSCPHLSRYQHKDKLHDTNSYQCNGSSIELGELPRQTAGEEDRQACLLCLGGFIHHYCLSWRFHTSLLLYYLSWRFHSSLLLVLEVSHITMSKWQSEIV